MFEILLWVSLGMVLLGLEVFIMSLGMLFVGALGCFYWAYILSTMPEVVYDSLRVQVLSGLIVCAASFLVYLAFDSWKLKKHPRHKKKEHAKVIYLDSGQEGQVEWQGERWHFRSDVALSMGEDVVIEKVEGLTVIVSRK